jgi:hypothetical protein
MHYLEIVDVARVEISPCGEKKNGTGFYEISMFDDKGKVVFNVNVHGKPGVNPDILSYGPICEVE